MEKSIRCRHGTASVCRYRQYIIGIITTLTIASTALAGNRNSNSDGITTTDTATIQKAKQATPTKLRVYMGATVCMQKEEKKNNTAHEFGYFGVNVCLVRLLRFEMCA